MTVRRIAVLILALAAACDEGRKGHGPGGGGPDSGTANAAPGGPDADYDGDGLSPNQGDCDDSTPLIGPKAIEVPNNGRDDDCDGQVDNVSACDSSIVGQKTADALAKAIGICDKKFLTDAKFNGPSVEQGRNTIGKLGVVNALEGQAMAFISTGEASTSSSYMPQPGKDLSDFGVTNEFANPYLNLPMPPPNGCSMGTPDTVNDYTELALNLTVPYNANSFSFQFQFFSAEYPEFVCTEFNDRFLVIVDDNTGNPKQVAFDMSMNPVSVNNGFFTICKNEPGKPQTQHCTHPVSDIAGTGYELTNGGDQPVGGSTGWLTTTVPVTPGDKLKLRFIIFDEGDHILDSAALIDNFQWLTGMITAPITVQ